MTARESLKTYRAKRRFDRTSEPRGGRSRRPIKSRFVVQRHAATSLHYDFRLEVDGVLKSWAVPKGLPSRVGDKRLAVETEDHPLEYIDFEGTIPAGEYGAGKVVVWDNGTYRPLAGGDGKRVSVKNALSEGQLEFELDGKKAHGSYLLKRMGTAGRKWLLLRIHARRESAR
jgi:DNA ligase D-like protein (predicted 3'-phosphoesterase)